MSEILPMKICGFRSGYIPLHTGAVFSFPVPPVVDVAKETFDRLKAEGERMMAEGAKGDDLYVVCENGRYEVRQRKPIAYVQFSSKPL